jgi:hypothetical protein
MLFYALAIWALILIRRLHNVEVQAQVKKWAWICAGMGSVLISVGILQIRSTLSLPEEQQAGNILFGLLFILGGLRVPWQLLHTGRRAYVARYRGARFLPAVMLLVIAAVAAGVALLSIGIMEVAIDGALLLSVPPPIAYAIPILVIAATASVIALGTSVIVLLLWRRLEAQRDVRTAIPGSRGD